MPPGSGRPSCPAWLPGMVIGEVTASASQATGLPEGLPIVAGDGDGQCAGLGAAAVVPGTAHLNSALGSHSARTATSICTREPFAPWPAPSQVATHRRRCRPLARCPSPGSETGCLAWASMTFRGKQRLEQMAASVAPRAGGNGVLFVTSVLPRRSREWDSSRVLRRTAPECAWMIA